MCDGTVQDVKDQLLASPRNSLRKLLQETGIPYSTGQRTVRKTKLHQCFPMDLEKGVRYYLWFQRLVGKHLGILDITWFMDEA